MPLSQELSHPGRALFPSLPPGRTFINAAYMTPLPKAAREAMDAGLDRMACPNFAAEDFFDPADRIRALLARLVGGAAARYSITGSASHGTATLAWNLRVRAAELVGERRRILGVQGQFPSNVQTWQHLAPYGFQFDMVPPGPEATARLVAEIDERTALVAIEPLSWTDGLRLDVAAVCGAARAAGALTLLDVTQSAGVDAPISDELPCDVVLAGGYKWLLGPYGTGFLRLSAALQERLEPLEWNWKNFGGSRDFNRLTEYRRDFASPAAKFDHGESSAFLRLAGWEAALETLVALDPASISAHARAFACRLCDALPAARVRTSAVTDATQAPHLFRIEPVQPVDFDPLSDALAAAGVEISRRNGGWRISPHVYNDATHIERILPLLV